MLLKVCLQFGQTMTACEHRATLSAVVADPADPAGSYSITWSTTTSSGTEAVELEDWAALTAVARMHQPRQVVVTLTTLVKGVTAVTSHQYEYDAVMRHQVSVARGAKRFRREAGRVTSKVTTMTTTLSSSRGPMPGTVTASGTPSRTPANGVLF